MALFIMVSEGINDRTELCFFFDTYQAEESTEATVGKTEWNYFYKFQKKLIFRKQQGHMKPLPIKGNRAYRIIKDQIVELFYLL
jgi:hypothetical protein